MKIKFVLYGAFTSLAIAMLILGFREMISRMDSRRGTDMVVPTARQTASVTSACTSPYQKNIAKQVLRFHVIANSNSVKDQTLKYIVRDAVLSSLQDTLRNAGSVKQAKERLAPNLPKIKETAIRTLRQYDCSASVCVSVKSRYFPVKQYGEYAFPAGFYDALCIDIGSAKGQNWWCVLFPSLCFVDETTAVVPKESKERLQDALSKEEYDSLIAPSASLLPDETPSVQTSPDADVFSGKDASSDTDASSKEANTDKKPKLRFGFLDFFK